MNHPGSRRVQRLDEPWPSPILRPPRQATVAGEREKVWLTVVVVLHLFVATFARTWETPRKPHVLANVATSDSGFETASSAAPVFEAVDRGPATGGTPLGGHAVNWFMDSDQ